MRETTIITKKPFTVERAAQIVELEKEISKAVQQFGYNLENRILRLEPCLFRRYVVYLDNKYLGIWDCKRKTFVD